MSEESSDTTFMVFLSVVQLYCFHNRVRNIKGLKDVESCSCLHGNLRGISGWDDDFEVEEDSVSGRRRTLPPAGILMFHPQSALHFKRFHHIEALK